jgi:4-carboxymuconolactone decarboxylase
MPRIPLPSPEEMNAEQRRVYDAVVSGPRGKVEGPLRAVIHNAALADKWQQLGAQLRYRTSLPPRLSELAILVTARHFDCQFEWYAHEPHALKAGLVPAAVAAIRSGRRPALEQPDELAVYDYAIELHGQHVVSDATYKRALDLFGVVTVVELTALLGYYSMVAMTLNAHELPLPAGVTPPLPPRG